MRLRHITPAIALVALSALTLTAASRADMPGNKRLNNLVIEHVNTTIAAPAADHDATRPVKTVTFQRPREGWVFISVTPSQPSIRVALDSPEPDNAVISSENANNASLETMRFVAKGEHTVRVFMAQPVLVERLIIRSVPAIMLFPVSFAAWEKETSADYGLKKGWDFLKQHMLRDSNVIAFFNAEDFQPYIEEWRARGGKALIKKNIPHYNSTPEQIYATWGAPLEKYPDLDGITIDEFYHGKEHQQLYSTWAAVFDRIAANPRNAGKKVYSFWGAGAPKEEMRALVEATVRNNFRWLHEGYYMLRKSEGDEKGQLTYINGWGGNKFDQFQTMFPGLVENNLFYIFGIANYHWSFDLSPELDFKVFLDLQFQHIVTHPGFKDMYGVGLYSLNSTTDEMCRYAAALVRHYCIEGNTNRFNADPLEPKHIENPGFEEGTEHWNLIPAATGGIATMENAGLPYKNTVTDRPIPHGKQALCTVRSPRAPNKISQTITGLTPGRFYSARVMVTDLTESETTRLLPVSLTITGAELIEKENMDNPWTTRFTKQDGTGKTKVCWNYRLRIFRATGRTAALTLSDWPVSGTSPGESGHKTLWDYVEVQPFYRGRSNTR